MEVMFGSKTPTLTNDPNNSIKVVIHRKLPNELFTEILSQSTPKPLTIPWTLCDSSFPWAFLRVCKEWRSVTLGTAGLWSSVHVDYEQIGKVRGKVASASMTSIAQQVLLRSGNAYLSLKITSNDYQLRDRKPLVDLVLNHTHRIRHLDLFLFDEAMMDLLNLPPILFQQLESLSIASFNGSELGHFESVTFQNSPHLRTVKVDLCQDWASTVLHLPWSHLTSLSLISGFELTPHIAHGILKQCPELVSLDIMLSDELDNQVQEPLDITLSFLKTLSVEFGDYKQVEDFLKGLTMPSLSRLEITSSNEISNILGWNREPFFDILCNFDTISILRFDLPFPPDYEISSFLDNFPHLSELTLPAHR